MSLGNSFERGDILVEVSTGETVMVVSAPVRGAGGYKVRSWGRASDGFVVPMVKSDVEEAYILKG